MWKLSVHVSIAQIILPATHLTYLKGKGKGVTIVSPGKTDRYDKDILISPSF